MKADPQTEAEVADLVARLISSLSRTDAQATIALFAPDADVLAVGTGADEARVGLEAIRALVERDVAQSESRSIRLQWQNVSAAGPVAWVAAEAVGHATGGGGEVELPLRITAVLERRDGTWLVQQLHVSTPGAAQAAGQSFPTSLDAVTSVVEQERVDLCNCAAPDGTVTLLFTDIENSTPLAEALGDLRWIELLREHNAIVRECIALHGGSEVKTIGDAFMVAFGSARRALLCAIDIQRAIEVYCTEHPEHAVRVRIGLHSGEPVREGNDFYGKSVVLASRIAGQARGGEILVSSLLRELAESAGDIRFDDGCESALKGLAGTHRLYAVLRA